METSPLTVHHYYSANPTFPQQPTADQWFDESQFESYRRLGAHTIEEIFGEQYGNYGVEDLITTARQYAYPHESDAFRMTVFNAQPTKAKERD